MTQTRIVFFDIDGTLIDMQKKQISPKTLEMLKLLKQNGISLFLVDFPFSLAPVRACVPVFSLVVSLVAPSFSFATA